MDEKIKLKLNSIKSQYKYAAISILIFGILAHGMGMLNKFSIHDDIQHLFGSEGVGYRNGRWMWAILAEIVKNIFGNNLSLPLWGGILSFLFIALSVFCLIWIFDIQSKFLASILGCLMVVRPVITGIFGYMFVAPYYMLGEFCGFLGVCIIYRYRKFGFYIIGILLMTCATGIYPAFIPEILCVMLFRFILTIDEPTIDKKEYIKDGFYYIISIMAFVICYAIFTEIIVWWKQTSLVSYKGIDHMWDLSHLGERILIAYYRFFIPGDELSQLIYPRPVIFIYYLAILFCIYYSSFIATKAYKKSKWNGILVMLSIFLIPLGCCFIFVMCASEYITGLMLGGQYMIFVYTISLIQKFENGNRLQKKFNTITVLLLLILNLTYIRINNATYVKAEFAQQRAISWYTTLITRIKSVDGYKDELPITYVNEAGLYDASISSMSGWDFVEMVPYKNINLSINNYVWRRYMDYWCGFQQTEVGSQEYEGLQEIKEMPCYPDNGSIKVVDGVIVVKFGEV